MPQLPQSFINSLHGVAGFAEKSFCAVHEVDKQVTSLRLNTHKYPEKVRSELIDKKYFSHKVPWTSNGYYLSERPSFYLDPLWHAGAYYVQDASSMSLEFALKKVFETGQPLRILDLCAAPGGKSALLADTMPPDSLLVSNEVIASRKHILEENLIKWGNPNIIITQNDAKDFGRLESFFDVIVVDAPCSGSGLFRKDPKALKEWSPEQVSLCSKRQKRILADVMPALKDNGLLIYSTCSFSPEEDEQIEDYLLQEFALENVTVPFIREWNIVESISPVKKASGYRFYPDQLEGEGFYFSCFRKCGNGSLSEVRKPSNKFPFPLLNKAQRNIVAPWIRNTEQYEYFLLKDQIMALPLFMLSDWQLLCKKLHVVYAGVFCGKLIRDQLIPRHELAINDICSENIKNISVSLENAIRFLRKEDMEVSHITQGWSLVTYQGCRLGWIKGISGRVNNYYPVNWRIRKREERS